MREVLVPRFHATAHPRSATMRTIKEIEADIKSAQSAMDAMSNIRDGEQDEQEGRGIFLDNCQRLLTRLRKELEAVHGAR